ncbi:MAG: cation:proton antiporter [Lewinellaceae bacterium]|nr:cation:proton antiporter [Lewinellaceae bacterium]
MLDHITTYQILFCVCALVIISYCLPLIRNSFFSALVIFVLSAASISGILHYWYPGQPIVNCLVYAIPLSIISSAIVLPSVHHLSHEKKEFLIYEASFSDIIGIMVFNFFTTGEVITGQSVGWFGGSLLLALLISVVVCFGLMLLLVRSRINERFFLMFSVLIVIYVGGKMLHLPSLITILLFGIVVNNWGLISIPALQRFFKVDKVEDTGRFLKSITGESSS